MKPSLVTRNLAPKIHAEWAVIPPGAALMTEKPCDIQIIPQCPAASRIRDPDQKGRRVEGGGRILGSWHFELPAGSLERPELDRFKPSIVQLALWDVVAS